MRNEFVRTVNCFQDSYVVDGLEDVLPAPGIPVYAKRTLRHEKRGSKQKQIIPDKEFVASVNRTQGLKIFSLALSQLS